MKIAYRMVGREHVAAEDVDYGDCAEFQVVCWTCREAVHKRGALGSSRQYFAHYRSDRSEHPDCEERVARQSAATLAALDAAGRGQALALFQEKFQEAAIAAFYDPPEWDATLDAAVRRVAQRPSFRSLARTIRDGMRGETRTAPWDFIARKYHADRSPYWIAQQTAYAEDFLAHLLAPNSFANFVFGLAAAAVGEHNSMALQVHSGVLLYDDTPDKLALLAGLLPAHRSLLNASELQLRRLIPALSAEPGWHGHNRLTNILHGWSLSLPILLTRIAYIDLLKAAK